MNVRKADAFIADAELQYQWYAERAGWDVAERYLTALAGTCTLIERQPLLGPAAALTHPRLNAWRFFVVLRPFHRHLLFYEIIGGEVILRRVLHGHRDFPVASSTHRVRNEKTVARRDQPPPPDVKQMMRRHQFGENRRTGGISQTDVTV